VKRFNVKKLSNSEVNSIRLKSQIGLQLWKNWKKKLMMMMMWSSEGIGKVFEYKSFSHRKYRLL